MATPLEREDLKLALKSQHIHTLDRKTVKDLVKEINKRLGVIELTHGVRVQMGRYHFDGVSFKGKIEGAVLCNEDGVSADKAKWDIYCGYYSLQKSDYGKNIIFPVKEKRLGGKTGVICGINQRSKKYPIMTKVGDRVIRCPATYVKSLLASSLK